MNVVHQTVRDPLTKGDVVGRKTNVVVTEDGGSVWVGEGRR